MYDDINSEASFGFVSAISCKISNENLVPKFRIIKISEIVNIYEIIYKIILLLGKSEIIIERIYAAKMIMGKAKNM